MPTARTANARSLRPWSRIAPRLLTILVLILVPVSAPRGAAVRHHGYLILPFEDAAGDPSRGWMREAMSISLGEYFLTAGERVVSRDDRLMAMEELSLPTGAPLTLAGVLLYLSNFQTASQEAFPICVNKNPLLT